MTAALLSTPLPTGWKYMTPENTNQKTELLEMVQVVRESLAKAWTINPRGKKKKLAQLDALQKRIMGMRDDRLETIMVNSAMQSTTCCGPLRGGYRGGRIGSYQAVAKNHVSTAMKFLDVYTSSLRSDCGTIGGDEMRYSIEFDGFSSYFKLDEATGSFISESGNEDSWANDMLDGILGMGGNGYSSDELLSTSTTSGSSFNSSIDGLSVTTSSFTDDDVDLGISITTWSSVKMSEEKSTSKSKREQFAKRCEKSLQDHESDRTSSTASEQDEDETPPQGTIEEVVVSMGDITVRASRKKVVRFCGVKPTMEENLSRARDLLASYNNLSQMWKGGDVPPMTPVSP